MSRPLIRKKVFIPPGKKAFFIKLNKHRPAPRKRRAYSTRYRMRTSRYHNRNKKVKLPLASQFKMKTTSQEPPQEDKETATPVVLQGYDNGFQAGYTAAVEDSVGTLLPPYTVLPEVTAQDVIAAGLNLFQGQLIHLLRPEDVYQRFVNSLSAQQPLSVVRIGDGELLALAHETVLPLEHALAMGRFLPSAGMALPDPGAREMLVSSLRKADIVGIPQSRLRTYQGLLFPVFRHYGISYRSLTLTTSTINYALHEYGLLQLLLQDKRVLIIGDTAPFLADLLVSASVAVTGVISPVNGFVDIPRVMAEAAVCSFDLALVASGIPAVVICQRIASELGKVALDFGHLADKLVSGEMFYTKGMMDIPSS